MIAFPKAASGLDPLTGAPTPITPAQRREAGIDATPAPSTAAPTPPIPPAPYPNAPHLSSHQPGAHPKGSRS